jgi:hypothetical protein
MKNVNKNATQKTIKMNQNGSQTHKTHKNGSQNPQTRTKRTHNASMYCEKRETVRTKETAHGKRHLRMCV